MKSKYGSQALPWGCVREGHRRRVGGHRWPVLAGLGQGRGTPHWPVLPACAVPSRRSPDGNAGGFQVSPRRFPANACFLLDAPQRPAQPPQRDDLLSLFFAQDIAHVDGG